MRTATIWKIQIPVCSGFAEVSRHYKEPSGTRCPTCGSIIDPIHEQLTVEWDDGSDQIGDFVHAGADIILQTRVAEQLRQISSGFSYSDVTFYDHPNLRAPSTALTNDRNRRVWLPYNGPSLSQLLVERKVRLAEQSTAEIDHVCETCTRIRYKRIFGVERKSHRISQPRVEGQGLFIVAEDLKGDEVFSPIGTSLTLCTSRVKEFIESRNFTNIEFLNYGDLI